MVNYNLNINLTDAQGNPIADGKIEVRRVGPLTAPQWDHEVDAADGPPAIQTALNGAAAGETVRVNGSGAYTWGESIEVPNGITLDVSNDVSVTVPSTHNLSTYSPATGATVYSLITNADRTSTAANVTIRGGTYDMSNMTETAVEYAGIWLHNCDTGLIDNVEMHGAGAPIFGSADYRGFGIALTRCATSEIRDSSAFDSAYDDIAVRGGCTNCNVVRSGGSGGSSGTIQTAKWGNWGLTTAPSGTTFKECYGRRIYDHDGLNTTWEACSTGYRLQLLGTDGAVIQNSTGMNGYCLVYTYSSATDTCLIDNMTLQSSARQDAIQIGTNGGYDIGTVTVQNSNATRNRLLNFNSYATNGLIDTVKFNNVTYTGEGTNATIVNQETGASQARVLRFDGCDFYSADTGITGTYDTVEVVNCTFHSLTQAEAFAFTANTTTTSGNTFATA